MKNTGVIFKRALLDARMGILGWGVGLGLLAFFEVLLYPTISEAFTGMAELFESPLYQALLGEAADAAAFTTPEGYLAIYMFALVPLYIAVYMVLLGLGIVSNDEERGRLDLLLGTPIPRWQVIVEKFAAVVVIVMLVLLLDSLGAVIGILTTPEMQGLSMSRLAESTLAMLPITLVIAAMTLCFSTVLQSRMLAIGLTGAVIIVSYFVNNLAAVAQDALGTVKQLSFFSYYSPLDTLRNGIIWSDFLIMLVIALMLFVISLFAFQRRDLAV